MSFPDREDVSSAYYLALALLYVLRGSPDYAGTARLALVLDRENLDRLVDSCGGMTLRIPTREEVRDAFLALLYYQKGHLLHQPRVTIIRDLGITPAEANRLARLSKEVNRYLRTLNPNIVNTLAEGLVVPDD